MKQIINFNKQFFICSLLLLSMLILSNSCQLIDDNSKGDFPDDSVIYFWANIGDSARNNDVYNFKATLLYTTVNDTSLFIYAFDDKHQKIAIFFSFKKNSGDFPREGIFSINYNLNSSVDIIGYGRYWNSAGIIKDYSTIYDDDWGSGSSIVFHLDNFDGKTISGQFSMDPPAKDSPQTFITITCYFNKLGLNMNKVKL